MFGMQATKRYCYYYQGYQGVGVLCCFPNNR